MPEGVTPYPRWQGILSERSRTPVIIANEIRRALYDRWTLVALLIGVAWGFASIIEFYNLRSAGTGVHTMEGYLAMLRQLLWFSLAVAAALGGPTLLEDARRSALELYLSRRVTMGGYLAGKVIAVAGLTTLVVLVPAVVYWASSYVFYEGRPEQWGWILAPTIAYALLWGLLVSGLALGISSVARSASGAALLLFGGFATLAYLVDPPGLLQRVATITALTADGRYAILSPFAAMEGQMGWLFGVASPHEFPAWWGLLVLAGLTFIGWALVALHHPRTRGEERV